MKQPITYHNIKKNRMIIPSCMIYGVSFNNKDYFYNMIDTVLGDCLKKVYICKSGNEYDIYFQFKHVHNFTNVQKSFAKSLDRNIPVRIDYRGKSYYVYLD